MNEKYEEVGKIVYGGKYQMKIVSNQYLEPDTYLLIKKFPETFKEETQKRCCQIM